MEDIRYHKAKKEIIEAIGLKGFKNARYQQIIGIYMDMVKQKIIFEDKLQDESLKPAGRKILEELCSNLETDIEAYKDRLLIT